MFYRMVTGLNNTYECSRSDINFPDDDPGIQIVYPHGLLGTLMRC